MVQPHEEEVLEALWGARTPEDFELDQLAVESKLVAEQMEQAWRHHDFDLDWEAEKVSWRQRMAQEEHAYQVMRLARAIIRSS